MILETSKNVEKKLAISQKIAKNRKRYRTYAIHFKIIRSRLLFKTTRARDLSICDDRNGDCTTNRILCILITVGVMQPKPYPIVFPFALWKTMTAILVGSYMFSLIVETM